MTRPAAVDTALDVAEFHHKFGIEQPIFPEHMEYAMAVFRLTALLEEVREYGEALGFRVTTDFWHDPHLTPDLAKQLDALVDLWYFGVGNALISGFDFDEAWRRVHQRNMAKERALPDGSNSLRFSKYDVVKPAGWTPPDHSDLVDGTHIAPVQWQMRQGTGCLPAPGHTDLMVTPESIPDPE